MIARTRPLALLLFAALALGGCGPDAQPVADPAFPPTPAVVTPAPAPPPVEVAPTTAAPVPATPTPKKVTPTTTKKPVPKKTTTKVTKKSATRPPRNNSERDWACDQGDGGIVICEGNVPASVGKYMTPAQYRTWQRRQAERNFAPEAEAALRDASPRPG